MKDKIVLEIVDLIKWLIDEDDDDDDAVSQPLNLRPERQGGSDGETLCCLRARL